MADNNRPVKKGCLYSLAFYGLPMAAYFALLHYVLGAPFAQYDWLAGAAAGLLTVFGISAIVMRGDAGLLDRNLGRMPVDGERVAICGTLETIDAPLRAPFSGTECAAYEYSIFHNIRRSGGRTHSVPHLAGLALTPSAVRSEIGRMKILAYPMAEGFPYEERGDAEWLQNARNYIAGTTFQDTSGSQIGSLNLGAISTAISLGRELLTDDDGAMRHDHRMINDSDISTLYLRETVVPAGEQVCLIGRYSATRGGVVPDRTATTRLIRGTREQVRRRFVFERLTQRIVGAILVAVPNVAMAVLFMRRRG